MTQAAGPAPKGVLVSDFDGTMTRHDFYRLALAELLPPETPDYWAEYRAGTITHFEALRRYFASIRATEGEVLALAGRHPDDWAAEIVVHLKGRHLSMVNWCIWHYRFGQNTTTRFINSKVHALYFTKSRVPEMNIAADALGEPEVVAS